MRFDLKVLGKKKKLCKPFFNPHCNSPVWLRLFVSLILCARPLTSEANLDSVQSPDWQVLDPFQAKLSKEYFEQALRNIYCPRTSWYENWIKIKEAEVLIRKKKGGDEWYKLYFSDQNQTVPREIEWADPDKNNSLKGLRIALDPGHIGGRFSLMEGRHFSSNGHPPVKEGELALLVAKRLKEKLVGNGAKVVLLREKNEPVTSNRPGDFDQEADLWVREKELNLKKKYEPGEREKMLRKRREVLFYRISEIRARAKLVNEVVRPDLVICLHLNAAPWPSSEKQELVKRNDFHVLVNGCYMGGELSDDRQRFEMIYRLVNGWARTEQRVAECISRTFSGLTQLPAFRYKGPNALKIGSVPGVWARNLLANRSYYCPVVFLEPYVANSRDAFQRIILGDYPGKKSIDGMQRLSLIEEYAECVSEGIKKSFLPIRE